MTDDLATVVLRIPGPLSIGSKASFLLLLAVIAFDIVATIYANLNLKEALSSSSSILHGHRLNIYLNQIHSYGSCIYIVISTAWVIHRRTLVPSILDNIHRLQHLVRIHSSSLMVYFREICLTYVVFWIFIFLMGGREAGNPVILSLLVTFTISVTFTLGLCGQLSCLLRYLGSFYDNLLACKKIELSVQCYQLLSNTFDDAWQLFKLPVFLITVWSFGSIIAHVYILLYPMFVSQVILKLAYVAVTYFLFFPILLIIRSCTDINTKAKKFTEQLYWKMARDKSFILLNNELLGLHFIASEEPVFTACGFFTLNYSLICSVISATTTYLVIILQFGKAMETTAEPLVTPMLNTT